MQLLPFFFLFLDFSLLSSWSCAEEGTPKGGPRRCGPFSSRLALVLLEEEDGVPGDEEESSVRVAVGPSRGNADAAAKQALGCSAPLLPEAHLFFLFFPVTEQSRTIKR